MLSVESYIEKAKECQNFIYNHRMGIPYIYGDSTFYAIKQNAMDCLFNGCKAIYPLPDGLCGPPDGRTGYKAHRCGLYPCA